MKIVRALTAILTLALLAGCYFVGDEGTATVGIELPEPGSESATPGEDVPALTRLYVINGGSLVPVGDGTSYLEIDSLTEDGERVTEVSVGPVPAGSGYEIVVAFGNADDGTGVFIPVEYAMTNEPFAVTAGQTTTTPELERLTSPFVPVDRADTLGKDLLGVVFTGDGLFTATTDTVYAAPISALDSAIDFADGGATLPAGYAVNSITLGAVRGYDGAPWLNTDNGLLPYDPDYTGGPDGSGFFTDFDNRDEVPGYNPDERDWNVLDSGAFVFPATTNPDYTDFVGDVFGYFQFDGGLGGVWDDNGTRKWMNPADMQDLVTGQPILDLDVQLNGTVQAFIASKLGTFLMPQTLLTEEPAADDPRSAAQRVLDESTFFEVTIDDVPVTITHVSIGSEADASLYLGTPRGALTVPADAIGGDEPIEGTFVPNTRDQAVVEVTSTGDTVVVLTRHYVVYSTDGGQNFERVPLYASSVGEPSDMLVDPVSRVILITGSQGLVGINY